MKDIGFQVKEIGQSHPRKLTGENLLTTVILPSLGSHCFLEPQMWSAFIGALPDLFLLCFYIVSIEKRDWLKLTQVSFTSQVNKVKTKPKAASSILRNTNVLIIQVFPVLMVVFLWRPPKTLVNQAKLSVSDLTQEREDLSVSAVSLTEESGQTGRFSLE